jgi:hypothetical protein
MTDPQQLFRQEALEFRASSEETPGSVVRLGARWLRWSYWFALLLVAGGVALAFALHTTTTSSGEAVVNGRARTFAALLPAAVAPQLRTASGMRLELNGSGTTLRFRVTRATAVSPSVAVPGLPRPEEPSILLRGRILPIAGEHLPTGVHLPARATVVLRSERITDVVIRQLSATLGGGRGGR